MQDEKEQNKPCARESSIKFPPVANRGSRTQTGIVVNLTAYVGSYDTANVVCCGGKTVACTTCHGADLKGLGPVPPLAGRSPSYTIRQMYDLQQGVRKGPWSALMKGAVEKLTVDDMIAIAAYTSSREP